MENNEFQQLVITLGFMSTCPSILAHCALLRGPWSTDGNVTYNIAEPPYNLTAPPYNPAAPQYNPTEPQYNLAELLPSN